ncbi:MAG: RdgB/HAM1 family non-canonical purine NTP pyrophosphatase [Deltaproteobacteria bacterium]|nr:RdgB/HAM1 family non-canonical purine NTP pyrophosphatase [Deltaproteobacteria bacterium]MBW2307686.1 RdgB/HAM1 family non-canonical purine NTP pyrophosphatase [Deltaproteobacteria bacterium]
MMKSCGVKFRTLVLATHNPHKAAEMEELLRSPDLLIYNLGRFDHLPEIKEKGRSFYENALQKALTVSYKTGLVAVADDSGLEVDYLGGRPGVYSARYAGDNADDEANNLRLMEEMVGVPRPQRKAAFICCMVAASPAGRVVSAKGECRGWILDKPLGRHGFGYDPLFYSPELACTFAQVPPPVKNLISHRARALQKLKRLLYSTNKLWSP